MYKIECFSFNLTMQSNNEIYKYIKLNQHYCRANAPPTRNIQFNIVFAMSICSLFYILLLLSGDIHPNPGPASCSNASESSSSSSISHEQLSSHLSIFHLNVKSLLPKIDLIRAESELYGIAVFSESWLKPSITDDEIALRNFLPPFRTDILNRPGGGVVIYARDTLLCRRHKDITITGLEAVWLEVTI